MRVNWLNVGWCFIAILMPWLFLAMGHPTYTIVLWSFGYTMTVSRFLPVVEPKQK